MNEPGQPESSRRAGGARVRRTRLRRAIGLLIATVVGALVLTCVNGLWPSWKQPELGTTSHPRQEGSPRRVKVIAYNIAKCFVREGGLSFRPTVEVSACLERIASLLREEQPHLVFLSEIDVESGPCPIDQVRFLADSVGMYAHAFAPNYSFGLPFFRVRSGNAILSRFPLHPLPTQQLAGGAPFYYPVNNRRALWVQSQIGEETVVLGSLRNDSFDLENNLVQSRELLARMGGTPALLAGDFNAPQGSESIRLFRDSGLFTGAFEGPATYPSDAPDRCIDYILAPRAWRLVDHRVIDDQVSDHRPVVSVFELP